MDVEGRRLHAFDLQEWSVDENGEAEAHQLIHAELDRKRAQFASQNLQRSGDVDGRLGARPRT